MYKLGFLADTENILQISHVASAGDVQIHSFMYVTIPPTSFESYNTGNLQYVTETGILLKIKPNKSS